MWVRNGVINIVDLSNNYYFITFSNKEYQDHALLEGAWSICDRYLTVRECSPNFNMKTDVIQQVVACVRFSRLSIKHCDDEVMCFISNIVGCWYGISMILQVLTKRREV